AVWVSTEETALLWYLLDHLSEVGDNGSFMKSTFEAAATHIARFYHHGAVKMARMCQNKCAAMCKLYCVVTTIKDVSGWTWSDDTGASITEETASTWDDYVAHHPEAKPFCNQGWPHLHQFEPLMPFPGIGLNIF
ncbi:hypothetical protein BDQ17DRAFT_1198366, partial [Cyathus striatus]